MAEEKREPASATVEPGAIEFVDDVVEDDTIKRGYTRQEAYDFLTRRGFLPAVTASAPAPALTAASPEEFTSAMIALIPSESDALRVAVAGGEAVDQLHVTLYYLGEAALISAEQRMALTQAVTRIAGGCCAVQTEAFGVAAFNPLGADPCVVLNIGGDPIEDFRESVEDALDETGLATPEQHDPWVAHLTLEYDPDFAAMPELFDRLGPITFDRVRLAFAGEFVDIPLMSEMISSAYTAKDLVNTEADMPYHVAKNAACSASEPWAVVKDADGEVMGCHVSKQEAIDQMDAINISESEASSRRAQMFADQPTTEEVAPVEEDTPTQKADDIAAKAPMNGTAWEGILVVEGIETGDGRQFSLGAITWADTPIPLKWQPSQGEGHDGSVVVGRIDEIWRDGENPAVVRGRGVFDDSGENGAEALRLVQGGFLRGVSVDPDSIKDSDVELVFPQEIPTGPEDGDGEDAMPADAEEEADIESAQIVMPELTIFHAGRLRGATLVDIPAFAECMLWLVSAPETMTAAAFDEFRPDAAMFANPKLTELTPMTVTDDGRVYGHAAGWRTCHTGYADVCVTAPREGEHAYYRLGEVVCSDGSRVAVGTITLGTGHAPTQGISAQAAVEHYDNTGTVVAYVATGEDEFGAWFSGAVKPGTPVARIAELQGSTLSGDWRRIGGKMRLVALLAVNRPGFPIPRLAAYVSHQRQLALVAAGVVPPRPLTHTGRGRNATIDKAMERIAKSIGRDATTRLADIRRRVKGV